MNAKILVFVPRVEVMIYLLLNNLHDCTFKRLRRKIENTTRFQSDPIGKVVNLSKKTFRKKYFNF